MASEKLTFYPSEAYVTPLTWIVRERKLPIAGEVLVQQGQRIEPPDIIAQAKRTQDFRIVDIARELRVAPKRVERYLRKKVGDSVTADEPVAVRSTGLIKRVVRAPVDGTIVAIGGGRMLLEGVPEVIEVRAYLSGTVESVIRGLGVRVETTGALIQAVWGCGGEAYGVLRMVSKRPENPLRAKTIDMSCHGAIVVSGGWVDPGAFEQAQQLQVRGIIAASMDGNLRRAAKESGFPVILTEGFGRITMGAPAYRLLQNQNGREACISGTTRARFGAVRPEIIIPLPTESRPSPPSLPDTPLELGMRVRVLRSPYIGAIGTVVTIPPLARRLDSGVQSYGVEVNLESGDTVFVPYVNLELLS